MKSLLLIPGPVAVAAPVLAAMARPMVDHRGPVFKAVLERVTSRLRPIFGTTSDVVILGGSGTSGLESAVASTFSPGEKVLACPIGVFGVRLAAIARAWGCDVELLETPWGEALDPLRLRERLKQDSRGEIRGILLTQNETSTGSQNAIDRLAEVTAGHPASVIVDAVSGLGASRFAMDEWGFDVVVVASQKALAVPPGLAMVAVSKRGWQRIASAKGPAFYLDLKRAREFAELGQTPWTPPVSIAFALDVALERYEAEGAERVWERHRRAAEAIRAAARAIGLEIFSKEGAHSATVVAIRVPSGVKADEVRRSLREEHGIVISGGQKELKGQIFRIGTMGDLLPAETIGAWASCEIVLAEQGVSFTLGSGVRAAMEVFSGKAQPALA
jgi:aspartate aminotransferase-like enzyme